MGNFVLDSFAVLSYLNDEPGSFRVKELLRAGKQNEEQLYMNWINDRRGFFTSLPEKSENGKRFR